MGSTPIARHVYERGTAAGKRVQALGGAKNHMVVLPDADLDMAADAAVSAGYGSAGERCMAVSVVVAVGDVADDLVEAVEKRLGRLQIGPGTDPDVRHGPAGHASASRQGGVVRRRRLATTVPTWWSTDGSRSSTATGSSWASAWWTTCRPDDAASTATRSSGRCSASCASTTATEALDLVNANPYGNGVGDLHPGRRSGA